MGAPHADERKFGLLVGFVFTAIAAYWLVRERYVGIALAFLILGAVLMLAGAAAPRMLRGFRRGWMRMAEGMGSVMTRVILFLIFFVVVVPIGFVRRLVGAAAIRRRPRGASYWEPYPSRLDDPAHFEKMY